MKISLQWLKRYVAIDASPEELERVLPMIGHEVEAVQCLGLPRIDNLVVGEVLAREPHPDADKLGVCKVDVGEDEPLQIVCGASNYKVGDRIPVAKVGAVLPGDFKIKKAKLRGVESYGMMCSPRELGAGDDHAGLWILTDRPEVGTAMNEAYPETEYVFELELTANRGDCASHYGIARELAAYYDLPLKPEQPKTEAPTASAPTGESLLKAVEVNTPDCAYYTAWSIRGVKIGSSPDWLRGAMEAVGLRTINNVVDVTNWVLMALGQPLHAFDAKKINGDALVIRQANDGESITTLDERKHKLDASMMVIADRERPLVVAGIMGSLDAEVDDSTTDIVLESAWFRPGAVRDTARKLNLHTDSSYRFSRDVDPAGVEFAARLAIDLILEVAGGEVSGPGVVVGAPPRGDNEIAITPDFVRERIGWDVDDPSIRSVFERLGFAVEDSSAGWKVTVPSVRGEVCRPVDLVEEFVRIHGTDTIPDTPVQATGLLRMDDAISVLDTRMANLLAGQRFQECVHYTLRDADTLSRWFSERGTDALGLLNPLTSEQSHIRPSLLPGLLDALRLNRHRGNDAPRLCETGRIFAAGDDGVHELYSVAFLLSVQGNDQEWRPREQPDFYTAKGLVQNLAHLAGVSVPDSAWVPLDNESAWEARYAASAGDWSTRGWQVRAGFVSVEMLKDWDVDGLVVAGELLLSLEKANAPRKTARIVNPSNFPSSTRDLAVVAKKDVPAGKVRDELEKIARKACGADFSVETVGIFDVYAGKGLADDAKSLAFSIVFRGPGRTLKDAEVATAFDQIQDEMKKAGYEIRS